MRRILTKVMMALLAVSSATGMMIPATDVAALDSAEVIAVKTNIFGEVDTGDGSGGTDVEAAKEAIMHILKIIVSVLIYGLGVVAVAGVVVCGVLYMTARDNEAQVAMAKRRLLDVVIGLIAWALMFALLNWLLPGGVNFDL